LVLEGIEGKRWWKLWIRRFLLKSNTVVSSAWNDSEISAKQGLKSNGVLN